MSKVWEVLKKWFAAVPDSIKGKINHKELVRVILTAALAAMAGGGIGSILEVFNQNLSSFLTLDPQTLAAISFLLTSAIDYVRRRYFHGVKTQ